MDEVKFKEFLHTQKDIGRGHLLGSARAVLKNATNFEEKHKIDLNDLVADDHETYKALKMLKENRLLTMFNVIKKYYKYKNRITFYRLSNYENMFLRENAHESK